MGELQIMMSIVMKIKMWERAEMSWEVQNYDVHSNEKLKNQNNGQQWERDSK